MKQQNQRGPLPETALDLPLADQFSRLLHELGRELWTKLRSFHGMRFLSHSPLTAAENSSKPRNHLYGLLNTQH
jgi:hypothetical protein